MSFNQLIRRWKRLLSNKSIFLLPFVVINEEKQNRHWNLEKKPSDLYYEEKMFAKKILTRLACESFHVVRHITFCFFIGIGQI